MQSFAQDSKPTLMCQLVYKELDELLRTPNKPFLWNFKRSGEAFIREHVQKMFQSDIVAALDDGHTQSKSKSDIDFDELDGGTKLMVAFSAV